MSSSISFASGIYTLRSSQKLFGNFDEIWKFFSRPENLNHMCPQDLKFKITSENLTNATYQGQIITYEIGIFPFLKNFWVTEITLVKEKEIFIDEQRFGPYSMWHHEHHFQKVSENEIMMTDIISYKLPFGFLGRLIAGNIIKKKLKSIFDYRFQFCERTFNNQKNHYESPTNLTGTE